MKTQHKRHNHKIACNFADTDNNEDMETKEVIYSGYDKTTSDYECPDGQLETSINLINEDGSLKPLPQPVEVLKLPKGYKPLFIHTTQDYRHLILQKVVRVLGRTLHFVLWVDYDWLTGSDTPPAIDEIERRLQPVCDGLGEVMAINAVKNTLCIMFASGLHYILWKAVGNAYKYLGQKPLEVDIQFGMSPLKAGSYLGDNLYTYAGTVDTEIGHNYAPVVEGSGHVVFANEKVTEISNSIWGLVGKVHQKITDAGHFYAPFFIRYCYSLYDGSMFMHSAPVYIPMTLDGALQVEVGGLSVKPDGTIYTGRTDDTSVSGPYAYWMQSDEKKENGSYTSSYYRTLYFRYQPANSALQYFVSGVQMQRLRDWSDIVKTIDVFVTPPIVNYKADGRIANADVGRRTMYASNKFSHLSTVRYQTASYGVERDSERAVFCNIPKLHDEFNPADRIIGFYKIKSLELEEIASDATTELHIEGATLAALTSMEVMSDDYKTHNILLPNTGEDGSVMTSMYGYNSRLNIANVRERLFEGFLPRALVPVLSVNGIEHTLFKIQKIYIFLDTGDGEKIVSRSGVEYMSAVFFAINPLFYPDNRAKKLVIEYIPKYFDIIQYAEFNMEASGILNGAFTQGASTEDIEDVALPPASAETIAKLANISDETSIVSAGNKIYTSEADNPFVFPATSINTVGSGRILNIAANTTALSQGQFGQHPFYAFATDGVWALSVSDTGTYTAVQPVSRDVCINPVSVTQTDNAILFITDRGIMMLTGSDTICISDSLDDEMSGAPVLPQLDKIYTIAGIGTGEATGIVPFRTYCHDARMLFDYMNQRLLVYNPAYAYMYAYSFKSKKWGMMQNNIADTIGSYPEALSVDKAGNIVSFDKNSETSDPINGLFITRPLKLGMADVLKSVYTVIQRGMFRRGDVSTVLYGSRDLYSWHLIGSSQDHYLRGLRGTPYKYFRIVGIARLGKGQSLSGATLEIEPKHTDRLR